MDLFYVVTQKKREWKEFIASPRLTNTYSAILQSHTSPNKHYLQLGPRSHSQCDMTRSSLDPVVGICSLPSRLLTSNVSGEASRKSWNTHLINQGDSLNGGKQDRVPGIWHHALWPCCLATDFSVPLTTVEWGWAALCYKELVSDLFRIRFKDCPASLYPLLVWLHLLLALGVLKDEYIPVIPWSHFGVNIHPTKLVIYTGNLPLLPHPHYAMCSLSLLKLRLRLPALFLPDLKSSCHIAIGF